MANIAVDSAKEFPILLPLKFARAYSGGVEFRRNQLFQFGQAYLKWEAPEPMTSGSPAGCSTTELQATRVELVGHTLGSYVIRILYTVRIRNVQSVLRGDGGRTMVNV